MVNRKSNTSNSGLDLEKIVCRIQQLMDPYSKVTHNEYLVDRVGNRRQYDVVVRGKFGGRSILGIIECKDHKRRKGPSTVEAFSKKTEDLHPNFRIIVSRKGFTKQALDLAKHEYIGCLTLLPECPDQVGFSIGDMWYGILQRWSDVKLAIHFDAPVAPIQSFNSTTVLWNGKPVMNWFLRELFTTHQNEEKPGEHRFNYIFNQTRKIEIEKKLYPVKGFTCIATRIIQNKRKWVHWKGDAFYDWNTNMITIPPKGSVVGSAVETDLTKWDNYEGEIPSPKDDIHGSQIRIIVKAHQTWPSAKNSEIPDLSEL